MSKSYLFDKVSELKDKFSKFFQHRKKLKALENYSEVGCFQHKNYLTLIKHCMTESFLEEKEADFLDHMLNKYELNYLDWAHRTKWLKSQMAEIASETLYGDRQMYIDFNKTASAPKMPFELMLEKTNTYTRRI